MKRISKFEKTLRAIEKLEKKWRYELSPEEERIHSFGKISPDDEIAFWSVPRNTGEFLKFMVEITKPETILELGCSAGYSTLWLAEGAEGTDGHVYTTEILQPKIELAKKHFQESGLENKITLIEDDISNVLKSWNKSKKIDFLFLDADKQNYPIYHEIYLPLLRRGGLIIMDNALHTRFPGNILEKCEYADRFVKLLKKDRRISKPVILEFDNGLLLTHKL